MSWPLGYGKSHLRYTAAQDGTIYANGVAVTDVNGWIDLPPPAGTRSAPYGFSIRVRLSVDELGSPYFYAEQVDVGGRRYSGIHALLAAEGEHWWRHLAGAFQREMDRRIAVGSKEEYRSRVRTTRSSAVHEQSPPRGADETWDHRTRRTTRSG